MKILITVTSLAGGGAERVATDLARSWILQGFDVEVATLASEVVDFYTLDDRVVRHSFNEELGADSVLGSLVANTARIYWTRNVIKDVKPDVIVSVMTYVNILTLIANLFQAARVIVTEHNYPPRSKSGFLWSFIRKYVYRLADTVVALNPTCESWLREHTFSKNIVSIPNAISWPLPVLEPVVSTNRLDPGRKYFMSVGRLSKQKSLDRMIKAYALLALDFPLWDLVIIGEGEELGLLSKLVSDLGLRERIQFTGRVGNIQDWYAKADVFALSSSYEGFPGSLLEAMASGVAVVSVDCKTGPRDIIENGVNGLLVQEDLDSLSRGMRSLASDEALRAKLGLESVNVLEKYNVRKVSAMWTDQFLKLGLIKL